MFGTLSSPWVLRFFLNCVGEEEWFLLYIISFHKHCIRLVISYYQNFVGEVILLVRSWQIFYSDENVGYASIIKSCTTLDIINIWLYDSLNAGLPEWYWTHRKNIEFNLFVHFVFHVFPLLLARKCWYFILVSWQKFLLCCLLLVCSFIVIKEIDKLLLYFFYDVFVFLACNYTINTVTCMCWHVCMTNETVKKRLIEFSRRPLLSLYLKQVTCYLLNIFIFRLQIISMFCPAVYMHPILLVMEVLCFELYGKNSIVSRMVAIEMMALQLLANVFLRVKST